MQRKVGSASAWVVWCACLRTADVDSYKIDNPCERIEREGGVSLCTIEETKECYCMLLGYEMSLQQECSPYFTTFITDNILEGTEVRFAVGVWRAWRAPHDWRP